MDQGKAIVDAVSSAVLGRPDEVRLAVAALVARSHLLIEDSPGTGKTLLARSLATAVDGTFQRVQATPDLLPADITGHSIYQPNSGDWSFRAGPVFANVLLVDEINRASPRTQAALLEPMEEGQVTVDGETRTLPDPFFVIATQNPLGDAGTFPLPQSQLDRFGLVLSLGRADRSAERALLSGSGGFGALATLAPVGTIDDLRALSGVVPNQHVDPLVLEDLLNIVDAVRAAPGTLVGPSPRASLSLLRLAQSVALLDGRDFVTPRDTRAVAPAGLAHRCILEGSPSLVAARHRVADVVASVAPPPPA